VFSRKSTRGASAEENMESKQKGYVRFGKLKSPATITFLYLRNRLVRKRNISWSHSVKEFGRR
jgi:hypothetical protein